MGPFRRESAISGPNKSGSAIPVVVRTIQISGQFNDCERPPSTIFGSSICSSGSTIIADTGGSLGQFFLKNPLSTSALHGPFPVHIHKGGYEILLSANQMFDTRCTNAPHCARGTSK
jgi:hypothetical protein